LREDPSYFADTLSEYEEHAPYKDTNTNNQPSQRGTLQAYQNIILEVILDEAYFMLAAWSELDRQLAYLEVLHGNPDMHAQGHAQKFIMNSFSRWKEKPDWIKTPGVMSWTLESIDRLLQCKNMLSTRLLSLLTDVSVLGEVLRQVALWEKPPNIRKATMEHTGCGEQLNETMTGFCEWTWVQGKLTLSLRCVQPFKEALLPGTQAPDTRHCRDNATCRGKPG
jgi:hypothetical protein